MLGTRRSLNNKHRGLAEISGGGRGVSECEERMQRMIRWLTLKEEAQRNREISSDEQSDGGSPEGRAARGCVRSPSLERIWLITKQDFTTFKQLFLSA